MSLEQARMVRALGAKWTCGSAVGCGKGASALTAVHAHDLPAMSEDR